MFASTRCRPHSGVGDGLGAGVPGADATRSTWAPPAREQRPVNAPWLSMNVVGAVGHCSPRIEIPAAISVPGANGAAGTTDVSGTRWLPPRFAGLVQAVSSFGPCGRPSRPAPALTPRPKIAPAGGVSLNALNAITHDSCLGRSHVGTWRNTPPRSF